MNIYQNIITKDIMVLIIHAKAFLISYLDVKLCNLVQMESV